MGLSIQDCEILYHSKAKLEVSFERTLMLGRLRLFAKKENLRKLALKYTAQDTAALDKLAFNSGYSEPFFKLLGASHVDSLDYSDYEEASIIHDLNKEIPEQLVEKYSVVVDGGTIEHVFNFPVAIKNCIKALQIGGTYIGITPANNQMGHGFYQFSPELYFRIFSPENGFKVCKMLIRTSSNWYEVSDPKVVKSRVTVTNSEPAYLIVIAKKEKNITDFHTPQQSDYEATWEIARTVAKDEKREKESQFVFLLRKLLPNSLKHKLKGIYNLISGTSATSTDLGQINTTHLRKIDL